MKKTHKRILHVQRAAIPNTGPAMSAANSSAMRELLMKSARKIQLLSRLESTSREKLYRRTGSMQLQPAQAVMISYTG